MLRIVTTLLVLWIVILAVAVDKYASQPANRTHAITTPSPPALNLTNLTAEITALDHQLFDAVFTHCDLQKLETLLAPDFEFLHDKGGLIATNAAQFLVRIRASCDAKNAGREQPSRRQLVSSEIFPLAHYGAIQTGIHRFFILEPGKPDRPGDTARFTHVWRKSPAGWQITRVLSYDHQAPRGDSTPPPIAP